MNTNKIIKVLVLIVIAWMTSSFSIASAVNLSQQNSTIAGIETGCVKWQFQTFSRVHQAIALDNNSNVYACSENGLFSVYGGWAVNVSSEITTPPSIGPNGNIYFGCADGKLHSMDSQSLPNWSYQSAGVINTKPLVTADGNIYFGSEEGTLYAVSAVGNLLWQFNLPAVGQVNDAIMASPVIGIDGSIYVCGVYNPVLYALDPQTGSQRWTAQLNPGSGLFIPPVISPDGTILLIQNHTSVLIAIDHNNGSVIRQTNLADGNINWYPADYADKYPEPKCLTEFVIDGNGTIYVSLDDPYLRAINPDGTVKWVTRLGMVGGFTLSVTGDGLIYAACDDGTLYVVDQAGNEISRFEGSGFLSYPVIGPDGTIYLSDSNGFIWAIHSEGCAPGNQQLHRLEDTSGDGTVSFHDFSMLAEAWMNCTDPANVSCSNYNRVEISYLSGDINRDLYVDFNDLILLAGKWLNNN